MCKQSTVSCQLSTAIRTTPRFKSKIPNLKSKIQNLKSTDRSHIFLIQVAGQDKKLYGADRSLLIAIEFFSSGVVSNYHIYATNQKALSNA